MRRLILATALAAVPLALATPAAAQSRADQARWDAAQQRFQRETDLYYAERDRYYAARDNDRRNAAAYGQPSNGDWDAARYYREDPRYQERVLANDDRIYSGSDGRYYCRRPDGTTGLIVGGAAGGVLGNVIDGGRSRTAGTLVGAALGALIGKGVEQNQAQIRCR